MNAISKACITTLLMASSNVFSYWLISLIVQFPTPPSISKE